MTDATTAAANRRHDRLALLLFLLLPAILLGDSLFTSAQYLSFDIAEFPPISQTLTTEQIAAVRSTANKDATEAPIWFAIELQLAREAIADGHLPQWNPYVRAGAPMLAHGHLGLLNPLHWPALLFADPADGLLYLTYAMFALAGMFMFGFLRAMKLGLPAAAFGALAFAWSGTVTANGHWFMRLEPLAMLPGMLWAIAALSEQKGYARALPTAGLALTMAGTWLSGFPQYGVPVTLLAAAFGLAHVLRELRRGTRPALQLAGWLLLGGGLGILLAMPQLLQMLHFYPDSNRPLAESLDRAARHAFAPFGFLGYLFPEAFSHPGDHHLPTGAAPLPYVWSDLKHWETGEQLLPNYNFTEYAVFPGLLPLLLASIALCSRGPAWRWFAVGSFAAVWLLATGAFGAYLLFHLPGIKPVPPYRFAGPACALLAMLAAIGLDGMRAKMRPWLLRSFAVVLTSAGAWCIAESTRDVPPQTTFDDPWLVRVVDRYRDTYSKQFGVAPQEITPQAALMALFSPADPDNPGRRLDAFALGRERFYDNLWRGGLGMFGAAAFLFLVALRGRQGTMRGWPTWVVIGLTATELAVLGIGLNRGQALEHAHDSPVHQFLRERRDAPDNGGGFLVARGFDVYNLPGGTLAAEHIRDLNFYTFVDNKSDLPIRKLYGDAFILRGFVCDAFPDDDRLTLPWWDLMGLRYVLSTRPMLHAGDRVGPLQVGNGDYFVYERPNAMPRAWMVPALRVIDDEAAAIEALTGRDLDPRASVIVSRADAERLGALPGASPLARREVEVTYEDRKRVTVHATAGAAGYLVLNDTFFAGWQASIAGEVAPIGRGNLFQRVVRLPAVACDVEFRFQARGLIAGSAIGGSAALLLLGLLLLGWRSRRKSDH